MIVLYNPNDPALRQTALRMGRMIHIESHYADKYDYSEVKLLGLIAQPNVFLAFSVVGGEFVGFFLGMAQNMWFSSKTKYGFDLSLYIAPKHRGGTHAVRLIREFEKFCKAQGCV